MVAKWFVFTMTVALLAACGTVTGSTTPTPSARASPSPSSAPPSPSPSPAIGDPCLVGRWVEQKQTSPGNWTWNSERISVSGLQGLVVTYSADGGETVDFSGAQPLIGDYHGHEIRIVLRGSLTYQDTADGRRMVQSKATGDLTPVFYYDGAPQPGGNAAAAAQTLTYSCAGDRLHLESPAVDGVSGPQVDELIRG